MKTADPYRLFETHNLFKKELHLDRNEYLSTSGSIATDIYFIKEGSLKVYVINNGEEQIIRFGYQNNIIVSLDSFLSGKPSDFFIQAIKKSTIQVVAKEDLIAFFNSEPAYLKWWIAILEDLVLQQIEREKDLLIALPIERYERVLKRSPQLFQEIPNKHIANYLRMTPETLSRLKKS
ncbi:Crp/Fnr family transcriptional regulator [Paenimyroides aestuarii]|uniref:Crp/Fnr family transcriptional regulator n=1 Tax=Paenimyroides aestuarii TaxID=2968490 RepID=A0ABY5NWM4_9FLAO|nr:Crp/Fnr family transcriptional regulator [Paenimyroides aestuarii]UUV22782.1 Crp/Fnr family transcriptional regulator [Paenimyroides aestuarii]